MTTFFDVITVTCFVALVIAFFQLTDRDAKTLVRLLPAAIAFAAANQLGNAGAFVLALILILAGVGYSVFIMRT